VQQSVLESKANTHLFPVLHFSTSMGYKGEIILLANLVYFMYAWYRDGHIVSLCILHLCMQYMGNGRARKGRSMELGGVREGGAVGRNSTSPPPGSATAIGTAAAPTPNGTSTSAGIGTSVAPDHNGTSTFASIDTSATPGGDATSN
jgi:hypothetical protein